MSIIYNKKISFYNVKNWLPTLKIILNIIDCHYHYLNTYFIIVNRALRNLS